MRAATAREYAEAPVGRFLAGSTWIHVWPREALCGFSMWGEPGIDDMTSLVGALAQELGRARHASVVDVREVTAVDPVAFDVLRRYVDERNDALAAVVSRLGVVLPRGGLARAAASGFWGVARAPYPVRTFDALVDALAWLGDGSPDETAQAISAERDLAMGTAPLVRDLRAWLDGHVTEATVEAAAQGLALSTRSLQRRLAEAGTSFSAEVRGAQVRVASRLLADPAIPVTRIAIELGTTPAHFSALFKEATGLTPTEWRARR